jgi:prepilin-type N-terminal cleavage/methylation domain-containing protein
MRKSTSGFTIVELLIVIVVIAVLAVIAIVAYNGIQNRASDTAIRSGVSQFEKALRLWLQDHPPPINGGNTSSVAVSNGECSDGSSGFIASGTYTCTIDDALISAGRLPTGFMTGLPRNTHYGGASTGRHSTMLYRCSGVNRYALYWTLRNPSAQDSASIDDTLASCGSANAIRDTWGMRAGKILQF